MRDMIKYVISQFFVITVGILFVTSVPDLIISIATGKVITYPMTYPLLVIFTGMLSSFPSFLLWFKEEPTKKQCYIHMVLHFVAVEAIVMLEGFCFQWYQNTKEALVVFGMVALVYVFVYAYSYFTNKDTADAINEALSRFNQDKEV